MFIIPTYINHRRFSAIIGHSVPKRLYRHLRLMSEHETNANNEARPLVDPLGLGATLEVGVFPLL